MFTRRRKSWSRRKSWERKTQRRPWMLTALLLLLGLPVGLELLARLVVSLAGTSQQFETAQSEQSKKVEAYRLKFLSPKGQPYQELSNSGDLSVIRNPLIGYQLLPQQKNQFWAINPQGFRDTNPIAPEKPAGEVRIFVLGGSAAFGQLSSNNEATFAHQLEQLLNSQVTGQRNNPSRYQPEVLPYLAEDVDKALALPPRIADRQYRVINAAVPGYASGNELAMLMLQVSNYSPDMIIVLDSYADLLLPSTQSGADIPGLDEALQGTQQDMSTQVSESVKSWFNQMYLVQGFQRYIQRSPLPEAASAATLNLPTTLTNSLEQTLTADPAELDRRVQRYRNHLKQIVRWSSVNQQRLFIGIQPEIANRQKMTPEETAIIDQLGETYAKTIKAGYTKLTAATNQLANSSSNVKLLDLRSFAALPDQVFQSPTSLTDTANRKTAEQFYRAIAVTLALRPKPFGS
ncbi:MAG: SGNH/GDSL hydrolase family protein [Leptolyngbyaceae cyanobacterium CRU_2_3]|nr:SGNH/GDSL hydrolase family protein [Leptolyngbyaceae cyanobacterium CRU_2_3]